MIIVSFFIFLGLVGLTAYLFTRRHDRSTASGYFLAGRTLGYPVIALSLFLTNLSTEQMVGMNGASFVDGIIVMAWDVVAIIALIFMALYFLPKFLKSGISTIPELLELRFDHATHQIANLIFLLAYICILLPIILYSSAMGLSGILDLKSILGVESDVTVLWLIIWVVGIIGSVYSLCGGLKSLAVSDMINGIGLFIGGFLIIYYGLEVVGGSAGAWEGLVTLYYSAPEKFNSIGGEDSSVPFGTLFSGILLLNVFYWCTNQQIIQRTLGAKSLAEGQKGVLLMGGLQLITPLFLVLPGIIAYQIFGENIAHTDRAYGMLVNLVLPPALTGVFAAVMVGAILSSFNSALSGIITLFSLGVYKSFLNREAGEASILRAGKIFGWCVALSAMLLAPFLRGQESLFAYLQKMNGIYFIPLFSVVLVGLVFKRIPPLAAKAGLLGGCLLIAGGYFIPISSSAEGYVFITDYIHEFHFLGIIFLVLVVGMLVLGYYKPLAKAWEHESFAAVEMTPFRYVKAVSVVLVMIVIMLYWVFADFS